MFSSANVFGGPATPTIAVSPDAKRPREERATCLPVTIRAMEVAVAQRGETGEDLKFFGTEPGALILVAAVESVTRQSTGLEMTLNDSTGRIKARYFVSDPQPGELESIVPGVYVSAFGSLRTAPAMHFSINGLRLVDSADEVSYHMIEVAFAMLRLQQPEKEAATPAPKKAAVEHSAELAATPEKMRMEGAGAPVEAAVAPTPVAAAVKPAPAPQGAGLRSAILNVLRADGVDPQEGLSFSQICAKLGSVSEDDVRACSKALIDEGDLFETIDEHHVAVV